MPESIFQTYLNRLTDLSQKNRSLYLPRLDGFGMLDLKAFDFLIQEPAFELIRKLLEGKKNFRLTPDIDPRSSDANQLSKALSRLAFRDQLIQEETGEQNLYVGWLFAEGKLINGQLLRSPLLLKPVRLQRQEGYWHLLSQQDWQWNPAFPLAWRHATGRALPDDFSDQLLENLPKDSLEARTILAQLIPRYFDIQVQSNLLEDALIAFPQSQNSLDQTRFSDGKVTLRPYAVLGQFAQKGSFLFSDYEMLMRQYSQSSLSDLFDELFLPKAKFSPQREANHFPVFPLDASQEHALLKIRQGNSLVIEGPPGTGKSQLIANLVTDYIARGKKVLVVSQKRAALDVVYERLDQAGFGSFLALVHDYRADQKELFGKVKSQVDSIEAYQLLNRGIDSIHLERELSQLSSTISRLSEKFEELRTALFDTEPAGIPVKALYLQADYQQPHLRHPQLLHLDVETAQKFDQDFQVYWEYINRFRGSFWENRLSFAPVLPADFALVSQVLLDLDELRKSAPEYLLGDQGIPLFQSIWSDRENLTRIQKLVSSLSALDGAERKFPLIFQTQEQKALQKLQQFFTLAVATAQEWRLKLPSDLHLLAAELKVLLPLSRGFLGKWRAWITRSTYSHAFQVLKDNDLEFSSGNLERILSECQAQIQLQAEFERLPTSRFFVATGDYAEDLMQIQRLLSWNQNWQSLPDLHGLLNWKNLSFSEFSEILQQLGDWMQRLSGQLPSANSWLTEAQFVALVSEGLEQVFPVNPLNWPSTFADLKGFDQFLEAWQFEDMGKQLVQEFADFNLDQLRSVFWNGWRLAWIGELERRNPLLSTLGTLALANEMKQLKAAVLAKRQDARHLALLRLGEQVSENLEHNRLGNRMTYRELHHQVCKKRQRWPIRKLVEEFDHEIFRLLPCWLGSPETVSAVFPATQLFDLVIFDEASQCQVERGLPAMLRGRQLVVAGDSKQLRPSDFYQVKWDSEEEGMEYEAESLLELASFYFEKLQLNGHYRSADPALIHFSNSHFYDHRLETLPDYGTFLAGKSPFSWEKVEGIWENQVNKMEAEAVVYRVRAIRRESSEQTIGIVTGNFFQMELIRDWLWDAGFQGDQIKVRTIENVQGDEFDQVILSFGYAPNREGKLVTNFGLLAKEGAENRLNVAITRARKKLHVISSLDEVQFRPSHLKNPGLVLLKEFLAFARQQSEKRDIPAPELKSPGFEVGWSLKNQLLAQNSSYSRDIPSAVMDLILCEENGKLRAILTDDQRFYDAPTAKAALAYHPILLEEKGWSWEWRWSRFWQAQSPQFKPKEGS
ncbi:AAA domain-containing protein [Algoriphagus namhaensis]